MKLVIAYTRIHPKTVAAVFDSIDELDDVRWADVSASDSAYYELLRDLWAERETFVVLEQDKVPDQGALRDIYDCPQLWCTYPHLMANGDPIPLSQPTLGCSKFSADLMVRWPGLIERSGRLDMGYGGKHWGRLDMAVAAGLMWAVGPCHVHEFGRLAHEHQN